MMFGRPNGERSAARVPPRAARAALPAADNRAEAVAARRCNASLGRRFLSIV